MKFLIAGDSWGVGEWIRGDIREQQNVTTSHGGLAQYLLEAGHQVENISRGGASNTYIHSAIRKHLDAESIKLKQYPDRVLVFQTTYTRDYQFRFDEDWTKITEAHTLAHIWLARFYSRLSEISQLYDVPVYVVGGLGDTVWLDNMQQHYPGVSVACQSMVNLIVNDCHRVEVPVHSWYTKDSESLVDELRHSLPQDKVSDFLDQIDLGTKRQNLLSLYPEYFFPDGVHPNREGHKKLYDFLLDQAVV